MGEEELKNEFAEKLFEHGMTFYDFYMLLREWYRLTKTARGCHVVDSQIARELKNMTPEEVFKARCQIPFEKLED